jgi:hypothetical protein
MSDYIKFCRLIDSVRYDNDKTHTSTPDMAAALLKAMSMIDDIISLPENFGMIDVDNN